MMRSLYSGVAGLKTHQTKMDVIGNNIANTNTVGFKSSSVNFSDTFYQTMSNASGANAELGLAGTNAKQIGLGSMVASITTNITDQGGPSTTNRALDIAINGDSFLVVRSGTDTLFTKSGALNVDEAGNLYCTTNGATVQGWLADADGNVVKDTVQDLAIMNAANSSYEPEATTAVTVSGNIDPKDTDLEGTTNAAGITTGGEVVTFSFFDNLGETYTAKMRITKGTEAGGLTTYNYRLEDILNSNSESIFVQKNTDATTGAVTYSATGATVRFGTAMADAGVGIADGTLNTTTGEFSLNAGLTSTISFSTSTGEYVSSTPARTNTEYTGSVNLSIVQLSNATGAATGATSSFPQYDATSDTGGVNIFVNGLTQFGGTGGASKLSSVKGDPQGLNTGNKAGTLNGISIDQEGKIYGKYSNGLNKCLGQIAVATFSNPSGLESVGSSMFAATLNSGEFDGVGEEVSISGSFTVGALEMSNVDLANEFTQMITTQRGFQANSRIITTSDSMLEELVNLKR